MWQNLALSIINLFFILTLLPAIIRNYKLKDTHTQSLLAYLLTGFLLAFMSLIMYTVPDLSLSSISTAAATVPWFILAYQKIKYSKIKS
jgi:multisubunit Na+/H+ antiporter MnhB subunit